MTNIDFDLFIIGGGINGAGIAADAAGRGLKVGLCEQNDLASATSSASTKLIHGGLRYLEHYEFRLVRESLKEREVLLKKAPHIIWPLKFVLPHSPSLRPAWMIRLGLFLYDHLGGRKILPQSQTVSFTNSVEGKPLSKQYKKGFSYYDCWVDDARLVVLNAQSAAENGAVILTRTPCIGTKRFNDHWQVTLKNNKTQQQQTIRSKVLINAAGPWVDAVSQLTIGHQGNQSTKLIKGSHIIVDKLYDGEHAYIFQNSDNRIVFAIPYEQNFTLIGTTDLNYQGSLETVEISNDEVNYLCQLINGYFNQSIQSTDVKWSYAGVRPLFGDEDDDPSEISRDYHLALDCDKAPILTIYGGKITTYRKLAEHALEKLKDHLPCGCSWNQNSPLPGGDIPHANFEHFLNNQVEKYHWLPKQTLLRLCRLYGQKISTILKNVNSIEGMGKQFGHGLSQLEIDYLVQSEWAQTPDDILWRRTKCGLHMTENEVFAFKRWFEQTYHQEELANAG